MTWWHQWSLWARLWRKLGRNDSSDYEDDLFNSYITAVVVLFVLIMFGYPVYASLLGYHPIPEPSMGIIVSIVLFLPIAPRLLLFGLNYISFPIRLLWHSQRREIRRLLFHRKKLKRSLRRLPEDAKLTGRLEEVDKEIERLFHLPAEEARAFREHKEALRKRADKAFREQQKKQKRLVWQDYADDAVLAADDALEKIKAEIKAVEEARRGERADEMMALGEALNEIENIS